MYNMYTYGSVLLSACALRYEFKIAFKWASFSSRRRRIKCVKCYVCLVKLIATVRSSVRFIGYAQVPYLYINTQSLEFCVVIVVVAFFMCCRMLAINLKITIRLLSNYVKLYCILFSFPLCPLLLLLCFFFLTAVYYILLICKCFSFTSCMVFVVY